MRTRPALFVSGACALIVRVAAGCGGTEPSATAPSAPPPSAATVLPAVTPLPDAPLAQADSGAATAPTEDPAKADARRALEADRAKWRADHEAEVARFTPELHAEDRALVDRMYPSASAAIKAVLASKHRKPGDAERDKARHPLETLTFFGVTPSSTVVELGPGEGWYTEILAPLLHAKGKLFVTTPDPNGPPDSRSTFAAQRFRAMLDEAPELYGNAQPIVVDDAHPSLDLTSVADVVLVIREVHGMVNRGTLGAFLATTHDALKAGGVLGIVEHRAKPGADPIASSKTGYVPQKWLIEQVEAAGFKLVAQSEVNANPKDTKDYAEGVWTLPPTFRLGDKDRTKYAAIGESDRMTLKFSKTAGAADAGK